MDRHHFLCSIFKKPILAFFGIPVCCVFAYMPSNPFSVFLCFRIPSGSVCPLFGNILRISAGDFNFSAYEGVCLSYFAKGKNIYSHIDSDYHRCGWKSSWYLDKFGLGALHHGYSLGPHSPVLFSCWFDGLLPSQKTET